MSTIKKTQARANRIAKDYAAELAELERQQREMQALMRAKKKELREAEQAELLAAQHDLGEWLSGLAGVATAADVAALREALESSGIVAQLAPRTRAVVVDQPNVDEADDDADPYRRAS